MSPAVYLGLVLFGGGVLVAQVEPSWPPPFSLLRSEVKPGVRWHGDIITDTNPSLCQILHLSFCPLSSNFLSPSLPTSSLFSLTLSNPLTPVSRRRVEGAEGGEKAGGEEERGERDYLW